MRLLWQQIPSAMITELFCKHTDGVVLDLEHGCFNPETVYGCVQVAKLMERIVLIRFPEIDSGRMRMCLDAGADGIILSTVECSAESDAFLTTCKYEYKRGQGLVRENLWGDLNLKMRRNSRDENVLLIPQIETRLGVENIDDIVRDEFAYYMVGPYDLSASYGHVGDFEDYHFVDAMQTLREKLGNKLGYHIVKDVESQYEELKNCEFLALGMDTLFLIEGAKMMRSICSQ